MHLHPCKYARSGSFQNCTVFASIIVLSAGSLQVKLNLPSDPNGKIRCLEYKFPGAGKQPIPHPLDLNAHARITYFEVRGGPYESTRGSPPTHLS